MCAGGDFEGHEGDAGVWGGCGAGGEEAGGGCRGDGREMGGFEWDMGGCKDVFVGWMGECKGTLWGCKGGGVGSFVGCGEEGGGCWSLHSPGTDKTSPAPRVSAELRLGWVRPNPRRIWGEKVNLYLGLFLTFFGPKGTKGRG